VAGEEWKTQGGDDMKHKPITRQRLAAGFALVVRIGLGCMFLYSSLPKIRQPYDFLSSVYKYELVGPKLGLLIAMVLPWIELMVGVCLLGGIFVGGALLVSIVMGAMFTFVVDSALYRDLEISCGCFSAAGAIGYDTLIRACAIMLVSIAAYTTVIAVRPKAASEPSEQRSQSGL
jgi:uncharacterized membrane protein YphA (DoxX/SURF4 family)